MLYIQKLGANLLSTRHLYEASLVGSFNSVTICFKLYGKVIIKATIENSYYIINYILKYHKEIAFSRIDYNISDSNNQQSLMDKLSKLTGILN
jgi:hypothetical protein